MLVVQSRLCYRHDADSDRSRTATPQHHGHGPQRATETAGRAEHGGCRGCVPVARAVRGRSTWTQGTAAPQGVQVGSAKLRKGAGTAGEEGRPMGL